MRTNEMKPKPKSRNVSEMSPSPKKQSKRGQFSMAAVVRATNALSKLNQHAQHQIVEGHKRLMKAHKPDKFEKLARNWIVSNGFYDACEMVENDEIKSLKKLLRRIDSQRRKKAAGLIVWLYPTTQGYTISQAILNDKE